MKAKILIAAAAFVVLAAPVHASTPTDNMSGNPVHDQAVQPEPNAGTIYGDVFRSPFGDGVAQDQSDLRRSSGRDGNNLSPPSMDASGVPDPRI
jgi:hypothetical protein